MPFRSVASHLVRLGGRAREVFGLDVLRPPTIAELAAVLEAAHREGRPYHVVHFDGHGAWLDAAEGAGSGGGGGGPLRYGFVSPPRSGRHGYLLFEDSSTVDNEQLVDGPVLGALLARTGVSVLVLNACRSAYAEAPTEPGGDGAAAEVHDRVRAYGSLALEVTDAGVPGVVAMRYSVYVVTAAQFVADLYAALLAGQPLGVAVTAGRRQLHAQPNRTIAFEARPLQDWSVPVVYEAAPLALFTPSPERRVTVTVAQPGAAADGRGTDGRGAGVAGLPHRPDVGFFGRDETLLALDRAFDTHRVVLLHAYAGAGKTSTAAEFARWYADTGGLDGGLVLFSWLEHHTPLARLLNQLGDAFGPLLQANGIAWQALDEAQRRDVAVQVLEQVPVLWVWDNVEPVAGFPAGAASAWSDAEQRELADFLRELADTRARVLLTSRRDERGWLGELPRRVVLPAMPMRERIQLTQALAANHGHRIADVQDWRPLLRYTAGNPLTVTVLVGQALREGLTSRAQIEAFVARLRAGETDLADDAAQGRSASLGASLGYGFANAFTDTERAQLAVLHLFQDTVDVDALVHMGRPGVEGSVPELAGLTREAGIALLDRAAEVGLLTALGGGYYTIHPALPWYLGQLYTTHYGPVGQPAADRVTRAYTTAVGALGNYYWKQYASGRHQVIGALAAEEANLLHARTLARHHRQWGYVLGCMQGLRTLYEHVGRGAEWALLVDELVPDLVDPATGGPLPGRDDQWDLVTAYRVGLARAGRDWATAERLQHAAVTWIRDQAVGALAADPDRLDDAQRHRIRTLAASLHGLGGILREQQRPGCVDHYEQAADLCRRIGARREEGMAAFNLGRAQLAIPELRDLDQAEHWYHRCLDLLDEYDQLGRAKTTGQLGEVARERFLNARKAAEPEQVLLDHLNAAAKAYHQALALTPADALADLAIGHNQLGNIYGDAGQLDTALDHYQKAIKNREDTGNRYEAGNTRHNVAVGLARAGRVDDALLYAQAALRDYETYGAGAAADIEKTRRLIVAIEQGEFGPTP